MNALLFTTAILPWLANDPAPGFGRTKAASRNLECERLSNAAGVRARPGQIAANQPRGDYYQRTAVICVGRMLRIGVRSDQDEAVLSELQGITTELAQIARSERPDLEARTWLVEAFHPSAPVTAKIRFAQANALMGQGLAVSDRMPTLAVGDLSVLRRMEPDQAYLTACRRWSDNGSLRVGDALLAVVQRDPRATILHAGVCADGTWTWLR